MPRNAVVIFGWIKLLFQVSHRANRMPRESQETKEAPVNQKTWKWVKRVLVALSLVIVSWFFYSVYHARNNGANSERISSSQLASKQLRTEVRTWFRKTFPESAARADEQFGFFEMERAEFPETREDLVVLAHGLDEPGNLWANLAPELAAEGYKLLEFRYPNDQPVHESSRFLRRQLDQLLDSEEHPPVIHLIGHSMGGLVYREFITHPDLYAQAPWSGISPVKTLIQLGTPNRGSWLATYRLPAELRDHLFKDYGIDALLGMLWDGAGEAQIDIKPQSLFLEELNKRVFPDSIFWVGIAGTGSPVNLDWLMNWTGFKGSGLSGSLAELQSTFPELFKGTGDGCVSVDSLTCEAMDEVHFVEAHHRSMVRSSRLPTPPAIPIIVDVLRAR